jgi:hypothetical protein
MEISSDGEAQVERVELLPDTDFREIIERIRRDGAPRLIERNGQALAVLVSPEDFPDALGPRSRRQRERLMSMAGVWSDIDADELIDRVYRARHETPPSPPAEG